MSLLWGIFEWAAASLFAWNFKTHSEKNFLGLLPAIPIFLQKGQSRPSREKFLCSILMACLKRDVPLKVIMDWSGPDTLFVALLVQGKT